MPAEGHTHTQPWSSSLPVAALCPELLPNNGGLATHGHDSPQSGQPASWLMTVWTLPGHSILLPYVSATECEHSVAGIRGP